jgi:hypothetical protein
MGMPKRVKRYGLALVGVGVAVGVIAPAVIAQGTDTDDFVQPVSTVVTTTSTKTVFVAQLGPATVTSTCTHASTSGRTPAHGLVMAVKPMSFGTIPGHCTDNLGAHDAGDIYKTSGVWHITFLDAANDEAATEPNSGDRLVVTVPIKGITITMNFDPLCLITVAPTAPAHVVGAYNDANTLTITKASVPISLTSTAAPGCPGQAVGTTKDETAKFTATYVLTPGVHDAS